MTTEIETSFSLKRVQEMLGLSRTTIAGLISAGFVAPSRGERNGHRFSFQDLMLLRTAHALQQARIPPRKILKSLAKLKAELPEHLPMTGLRIRAVGADVAVRDRTGQWSADSGQLLMDFEVAERSGTITFIPSAPAAPVAAHFDDWLERGAAAEKSDKNAAEEIYRGAIAEDPSRAGPYLNLGALLSDHGRVEAAIELYDAAARRAGHDPRIHFNYAVALEEAQRPRDACAAYERALALDPAHADAHFNLAVLSQKLGDSQRAIRHFSAYKRLQKRLDAD